MPNRFEIPSSAPEEKTVKSEKEIREIILNPEKRAEIINEARAQRTKFPYAIAQCAE